MEAKSQQLWWNTSLKLKMEKLEQYLLILQLGTYYYRTPQNEPKPLETT